MGMTMTQKILAKHAGLDRVTYESHCAKADWRREICKRDWEAARDEAGGSISVI